MGELVEFTKEKIDLYKDWLVAWLQEYPHISAAQMQD